MANTTKAEAKRIAARHANTAKQCREHLLKLMPETEQYKSMEREALDHETRAANWRLFAK